MATPRKRYYRQPDSLLREPWTRDQKLTLVLLQCHLNTRYSRDAIPRSKAGSCVLSPGDLQSITGKSWVNSGQTLLKTLESLVTLSVKVSGRLTIVEWPKWSEFQFFDARKPAQVEPQGEPPPPPPPPPPPKELTPPRLSSGENEDKPAGNGKASKKPKHPDAEPLARLFKELLSQHPGWTPPKSLASWETELDRMLRLDGPERSGIPADRIERVMRWVVTDSFEKKNVLGVPKLRKRFDALELKCTGDAQLALPGSQNVHKIGGWENG